MSIAEPMYPRNDPSSVNLGIPESRIQRVLAVVAPEPVLDAKRLASVERLGVGVNAVRLVVRMHAFDPAVSQLRFTRSSREREPGTVEVGASFVQPRHPDHDRCRVRQQTEALFAFPQRAFRVAASDPGGQQRQHEQTFKQSRRYADGHRPSVAFPWRGLPEPHDAARRQASRVNAPTLQLSPVERRRASDLYWCLDRGWRFAFQDAQRHLDRVPAQIVNGDQRTADDAAAKLRAVQAKDRCVCSGMKLRQRTFLRQGNARGVPRQDRVEDHGMRRERARAFQYLRERHLVGPEKREPIFERLRQAAELSAPELLQWRRADHDEDVGRLRKHAQDVPDNGQRVVVVGDRRIIGRQRGMLHEASIHTGEDQRRCGKKLAPVLLGKCGCRSADGHDKVHSVAGQR